MVKLLLQSQGDVSVTCKCTCKLAKGTLKTCVQLFGICQQTEIAYPFRRKKQRAAKVIEDIGKALAGLQTELPRFMLCW